jgi:hypothetical protein
MAVIEQLNPTESETPPTRHTNRTRPLFDPPIVRRAIKEAFIKLSPVAEAKTP